MGYPSILEEKEAINLNIRFVQANCIEGENIDPRQARAVRLYRPDFIFFEMPAAKSGSSSPFNLYGTKEKPLKKIEKIKKGLCGEAKKTPYSLSDVLVWDESCRYGRMGTMFFYSI